MTRVEFLTQLDHQLSALSKEQADEYLNYYAEMLADRMEDGMSEEEAVASMERVEVIARRILGAAYTTPQKKNMEGKWLGTTALAIGAIAAVALVGLAAVTLPVFSFRGVEHVVDTVVVEEETVPVSVVDYSDDTVFIKTDGIRALDISWISGNVSFEFWEDDEIGVTEYGGESVSCVRNGDTLFIKPEEAMIAASNGGNGDLVIYLPYGFVEMQLDTLLINVTSASVCFYDFTVHDLVLTTVSGWADIHGYFDTVSITSTSGDITLNGSVRDVTVSSISGNVFINCKQMLRRLKADTVSADISVYLPTELGFDLEFSSVSGSLSSGSLDLYEDKTGTHTRGDGTAEVYLETISGCVYLELE